MTPAAPSSRLRPGANSRVLGHAHSARPLCGSASRRTARVWASRVVAAGLLGCGLHVPARAASAPAPSNHAAASRAIASRATFAHTARRSAHVLAQLPRQPRAQNKAVAFKPRLSMPDFGASQFALSPIESPRVQTVSSAKQLRLSHRFFAQSNTPPRAYVMPKTSAPQFPAAHFPAFADSTFAGVQELPGLVAPAKVPQAAKTNRVQVVSNAGGGKMIQFRTQAQLGRAASMSV